MHLYDVDSTRNCGFPAVLAAKDCDRKLWTRIGFIKFGSPMFAFSMQAAGIADRLKARNIGFAISDAALDVVVKVRRDFSFLLWPATPE